MGSTLSARLDAHELHELQQATCFTRDELLELYAQFRFLSDNHKTITRAQFELGLAATGLTAGSPRAISRQATEDAAAGSSTSRGSSVHRPSGDHNGSPSRRTSVAAAASASEAIPTIEFLRAPTERDLADAPKVESLLFRLYDVMYEQAHHEPAPAADGDDKGLSFEAFCAALSAFVSPRVEDQIEVLFRLYNENADDVVTEEELLKSLLAVNTLLELPELSSTTSDDPEATKERLRTAAKEIVRDFGSNGTLTLPQFREAVRRYPVLSEVGRKLVVGPCADFFHASAARAAAAGDAASPGTNNDSVRASTGPSPQQLLGGSQQSAGAARSDRLSPLPFGPTGGAGSRPVSATGSSPGGGRSPTGGLSRRNSFITAPPDAVVLRKDHSGSLTTAAADAPPATSSGSGSIAAASLAHVIVHCCPGESDERVVMIAQRHRADFGYRPLDRFMHFIIYAYDQAEQDMSAVAVKAMHHRYLGLIQAATRGNSTDADAGSAGGSRSSHCHVAIKPVAIKKGGSVSDDTLEELITRFLAANPSDVVRLPFAGSVPLHTNIVASFRDLALVCGHGGYPAPNAPPLPLPSGQTRKPKTYIFCAEQSKTSERAARVLGLMMDTRQRDLCVVETIWSVGVDSLSHAYNDGNTAWKRHLAELRERSLKIAEHFRAKVAHGVALTEVAAARRVGQDALDRTEPSVVADFKEAHARAVQSISVAAAEQSEWDGRIAQLIARSGILGARMANPSSAVTARTDVVFVVALQSRSMAKKFYAATIACMRDSLGSIDAARAAASFVFVN